MSKSVRRSSKPALTPKPEPDNEEPEEPEIELPGITDRKSSFDLGELVRRGSVIGLRKAEVSDEPAELDDVVESPYVPIPRYSNCSKFACRMVNLQFFF